MQIDELQHAIGVGADGKWGPASRAGLIQFFSCASPVKANADQILSIASRLGCSARQIYAVAMVEASGSGFDIHGRPKMRFERHIFHRQTGGKFDGAEFSAPDVDWGVFDSWNRLALACAADPDAAFASASWGRFQVMGYNWQKFGFANSFELARSTIGSETGHFALFADFVEMNGIKDALRQLSADPKTCRAFADSYNGSSYATDGYDVHLAQAMAS